MRNKVPLTLMEQSIMLLIFSLVAALCLRAFVWSDQQSQFNARKERALLKIQSAAEVLKDCGGDFEHSANSEGGTWNGSEWVIYYDEDWKVTDDAGAFSLRAVPEDNHIDGLGSAALAVRTADDELLVNMRICWQEVIPK